MILMNGSLLKNKIIKKNGENLFVIEKNILSNINTISKFEKNIHLHLVIFYHKNAFLFQIYERLILNL